MPDKESENINNKLIESILYYYEVKMQGLGSYSNIVWSRFNWFLTLELALLGFLFTQAANFPSYNMLKIVIWFAGVLVSIFWLTLGRLDYSSLERHSERGRELNNIIVDSLPSLPPTLKSKNIHDKSHFRQTKILFILPGALIVCWGFVGCLLLIS